MLINKVILYRRSLYSLRLRYFSTDMSTVCPRHITIALGTFLRVALTRTINSLVIQLLKLVKENKAGL